MSEGLTARQTQILKVLVDEYIESTEPVGSIVLEKKYNLGFSAATIRNEMVDLTRLGYLKQPHTSAGRTPTPIAMKFYIAQLMDEKQMSLADEVGAKEEVWDARDNIDGLLEEITHVLANRTNSLSVAVTQDGKVWHAGYANIFDSPGLQNLEICQSIFSFIEESNKIREVFIERVTGLSPVEVMFGEDLGWDYSDSVGLVAANFSASGKKGAIGVIGPFSFDYSAIIPQVRYFGDLIQEIAK